MRLFAVACCRRVWSSLEHEEFRDAVRKAELFADVLDDPWWEDEFDKGDPLAPALVTARHAARAAANLQG